MDRKGRKMEKKTEDEEKNKTEDSEMKEKEFKKTCCWNKRQRVEEGQEEGND